MQELSKSAAPAGAVKQRTGHDDNERAAIARPWQEDCDRWEVDAKRRLRPGTFVNYRHDVRHTLATIDKPVESIDYGDLMVTWDNRNAEWEDRRGRPLSLSTYNNWVSGLQAFFAYLIDKEDRPIRNVAAKLDRAKKEDLELERKVYDPIPRPVFEAMLREAFVQEDYVWVVAAKFKWATLARVADLYHLRWRDIDLGRGLVTIRQPKRGGPVEKLLYEGLLDDLERLRALRRAAPEDYVFHRNGPKKPAFQAWFGRRLRKYAKAVGFDHYVHPHLVRASAATDLSERGVPVRDIMLQGGWKSMAALQRYLREDPEARRERLREGLDL